MDEINGGSDFRPFYDPTMGLPIGFGMSLAMNESAMEGFASMTEAEKEATILKARDAKSKSEMDKLVNSLAGSDDEEVRKLMQDTKEKAEG